MTYLRIKTSEWEAFFPITSYVKKPHLRYEAYTCSIDPCLCLELGMEADKIKVTINEGVVGVEVFRKGSDTAYANLNILEFRLLDSIN